MPVPFAKQGFAGICRDLQGSTGIYRDLQGYTRIYRDLQGSSGIYKDLQGSTRIYRDLQRSTRINWDLQGSTVIYKDLKGSTGSQGVSQLQEQKTRSKKIQKKVFFDLEKRSSRTVETHPGDINIVVNM